MTITKLPSILTPRYQCLVEGCGWVGMEEEMKADSIAGGEHCDEVWSNHICPACDTWAIGLEDYREVTSDD